MAAATGLQQITSGVGRVDWLFAGTTIEFGAATMQIGPDREIAELRRRLETLEREVAALRRSSELARNSAQPAEPSVFTVIPAYDDEPQPRQEAEPARRPWPSRASGGN